MSVQPLEATQVHTWLLKCGLEVEDARAYWLHTDGSQHVTATQAFDEYWFGARSMAKVRHLLSVMRARFDAFPSALATLHRWPHMTPDTRRAICHWHLQLADPLYRSFSGDYLVARRHGARPQVTRDLVVGWVGVYGTGRWSMSTRIQFASKLLSAALAAGLVASKRDPRPVVVPGVSDEALEYLMYLLREIRFEGTLFDNPYLLSVGLEGRYLEDRLRGLPGLDYDRQADLIALDWRYSDLNAWAEANLPRDGELSLTDVSQTDFSQTGVRQTA